MALVAPAAAHAAAPGQLETFGYNNFGQLGDNRNSSNGTTNANPAPTTVSFPAQTGPITQVAAGADHSLVLTSTGRPYTFGNNYYGQLGDNRNTSNVTNNPNPVPALVTLPGQTGPVTQIAAGDGHSLVLTSAGQLYTFGHNYYGQLGDNRSGSNGTDNPNPVPALVALPGQTGPVTQIAAGYAHSLALTATGQLYTFGYNGFGQLGTSANSGTGIANPTPTVVAFPGQTGPIIKIAAGANHSLALTSTGQLYTFGYNSAGQLGDNRNGSSGTSSANPAPAAVTLPGQTGPVTEIAAGNIHSLALTSTGQLYTFGNNYYGQLGDNRNNSSATADPQPTPALVVLPGQTGLTTRIAAGYGHSLALTSTGQLYTFGKNYYGQLGANRNGSTGTYSANPAPVAVAFAGGDTIETIAAGPVAEHTMAVVSDLVVTTTSLPAGQVGARYDATLTASGGLGPYSFAAAGLPAGLTLNGAAGTLTGTPTAASASTVTATVTDADGQVRSSTLALALALALAPVAVPANSSFTQSSIAADPKTGVVTIRGTVEDPGFYDTSLSFANGKVCRKTHVRAGKRCVRRTLTYGHSTGTVTTPGPVTITIAPTSKVFAGLEHSHRKLRLRGALTFQSARGGTPSATAESVTVQIQLQRRLRRAGPRRPPANRGTHVRPLAASGAARLCRRSRRAPARRARCRRRAPV